MYNFSFICRKSKALKNGNSPIELSIIINGCRSYMALPMKTNPNTFTTLLNSKKNNEVRDYCEIMRVKINKAINEMLLNNISITPNSLKDVLKYGGIKQYTVDDLLNDYLEMVRLKVDSSSVKKELYNRYIISFNHFTDFIGKDKQANTITNSDIQQYQLHLKNRFEDSTITKLLQQIKTAFTFAFENGKIQKTPFAGIKISKKLKEVEYLTSDELSIIKNKKMIGRLDNVRDCFIFAANTGLAFCDMASITPSDIMEQDGLYYIKKCRIKTSTPFTTILNDDCMKILEKYNYHLPIISNQKYNAYLKEIADICHINKPLHSHIARHTFATSMLNRGMSIEMVAKMLGHTTTKITTHYAKLLDRSIFNEYKKLG